MKVPQIRSYRQWVHRLGLYVNTARYLRPIQIANRIYRLIASVRVCSISSEHMPCSTPVRMIDRFPCGKDPYGSDGKVQFLNATDNFFLDKWDGYEQSMLWQYNLHYFDTLRCPAPEATHREKISSWIRHVEQGANIAWDPYPTSLRIVNWIYWHLRHSSKGGAGLGELGLSSLRMQLDYLSRDVEWHLLGNHLFENAKSLFIGGLFFEGSDADRLRDHGTRILEKELVEQLLEDGAHFELSPMYHSIVLSGFLEILAIARVFPHRLNRRSRMLVHRIESTIPAMFDWLAHLTHFDGQYGLFNDTAYGISPELHQLTRFAKRLDISIDNTPPQSKALASGYCRLQCRDALVLADFAAIGPQYLPGHAHADTLSFELSIGTRRVIVNSGTSTYEKGPLRSWQRSTAAHNTLELESRNSSEVWGAFRVARRASVLKKEFEKTERGVTARATHNGYKILGLKTNHTREYRLFDRSLEILDHINRRARSSIRFYLHPDCEIQELSDKSVTINHSNPHNLKIQLSSNSNIKVEDSYWYPKFGVKRSNKCIRIETSNQECLTHIEWEEERAKL